MFSKQPMIVLLYKEALLNTNILNPILPSSFVTLLQGFDPGGWIEFIKTFPYVIRYKKGKANVVANTLSHRYVLLTTLDTKLLGFKRIKELYTTDHDFCEKYNLCEKTANGRYFRHVRFMFRDNKVCVPNSYVREFAYNRSVHSAIKLSTSEIDYGANPSNPLELSQLPLSNQVNLWGKRKVFDPGGRVWVHMCKERFNANAYKPQLPGKYNVIVIFNVSDLSPFVVGDELDLRTNPFQE